MPRRPSPSLRAFVAALLAVAAGTLLLLRPSAAPGASGLLGRPPERSSEVEAAVPLAAARNSGDERARVLAAEVDPGGAASPRAPRTLRVRVLAPDGEPAAAGDEVVLLTGIGTDRRNATLSVNPHRTVVPRDHPAIAARQPLEFGRILEFTLGQGTSYAGLGLVSEDLTLEMVPVPEDLEPVLELVPRRAEEVEVRLVLPRGAHPSVHSTIAESYLALSIRGTGAPIPATGSRRMFLTDTSARRPRESGTETVDVWGFDGDFVARLGSVASDAAIFVESRALGPGRRPPELADARTGDPVVPTLIAGYHDGREGGRRVVRVELDFPPTFVLRAVDERGLALASATVEPSFTGRYDEVAPTGEPGTFVVRLGPEPHPALVARAPGTENEVVEVPPGLDLGRVVDLGAFELTPSAPLVGRILHADGTAAVDFEVLGDRAFTWSGRAEHTARTDAEGRFVMHPSSGEELVLFGHSNDPENAETFGPLAVGRGRTPVEVTLERAPVVELQVDVPEGCPTERVALELRPAGPTGASSAHRFGMRQWAVPLSGGRALLPDLRAGRWRLTVQVPNAVPTILELDLGTSRMRHAVRLEPFPSLAPAEPLTRH